MEANRCSQWIWPEEVLHLVPDNDSLDVAHVLWAVQATQEPEAVVAQWAKVQSDGQCTQMWPVLKDLKVPNVV